jgi:hypothetical protein
MAGVPVTIVGEAYVTGLGVGGGPMPPGGGPVDPGFGAPPGWGLRPSHPIVIPPGFIDGVHPEHPIVIVPSPIDPGFGAPPGWGLRPTHPIVIPPDLGIWGPTDPRPTNPIVIPPPTVTDPPRPTHPIVIPPEGPPQVMANWDVVSYWTEEGGWAVAIVPSATNPGVPTPSAAPRP